MFSDFGEDVVHFYFKIKHSFDRLSNEIQSKNISSRRMILPLEILNWNLFTLTKTLKNMILQFSS